MEIGDNKTAFVLFYHTGTMNYYFWNGYYPINVTKDGVWWDDKAEITEEEVAAIQSVIGTRKTTFTIKGRGKFQVAQKGIMNLLEP